MDRRGFLKSSTAVFFYAAMQKSNGQAASRAAVSFDERSLLVNGTRVLLSCGEMHYPRSTRAMWPSLLKRSKALGLNAVATYAFWSVHEPRRGVYDFMGECDLGHYLDLCQEYGLMVFLRAGPYICAEWNFGGFPAYLRDEPGITIRTMNKPYTDRVEAYFEQLAKVVRPRLASRGGPVVLVQIENEYSMVAKRYGEDGQEYLRWVVDMAQSVGLAEVPITTCEGGAHGAIETSNGDVITPARISSLRQSHPGTPLIWSELYPGWYRTWGNKIRPSRSGSSMSAGILDFIGHGGSGWNYYPWHGGTNFGRNAMFLQTTSYDFDAPLDEYGAVTATGEFLGVLHHTLQANAQLFLEGKRSESVLDKQRVVIWKHHDDMLKLMQSQDLKTAILEDKNGRVLFDTTLQDNQLKRSAFSTGKGTQGLLLPASSDVGWWKILDDHSAVPRNWRSYCEQIPRESCFGEVKSIEPIEQLGLTKDATDYCWYSSTINVDSKSLGELIIPYGGDLFYVFVDRNLAATSALPLAPDRGAITPENPAHTRIIANRQDLIGNGNFRQKFYLAGLSLGEHRLDILSVAIGMIKGDWQIASPMNFERKGIWEGVIWNKQPLRQWVMRPGLAGENLGMSTSPHNVAWMAQKQQPAPLTWYRCTIDISSELLSHGTQWRIDATGMRKGLLWVNGHCLGRYWLIPAAGSDDTYSQRYYHVPLDWLQSVNDIVVFEEQTTSPEKITLQYRKTVI